MRWGSGFGKEAVIRQCRGATEIDTKAAFPVCYAVAFGCFQEGGRRLSLHASYRNAVVNMTDLAHRAALPIRGTAPLQIASN